MRLLKLLWICCVCTCAATAFGQTDDCASATPVGEGTFPLDNTGFTLDGPTDCDSNMGADAWFLYTATMSGDATIETCGTLGTMDDSVLIIYDGAAGCPVAGDVGLACDDDDCTTPNFSSTVTVPVLAGDSILVQVGGFNGATGTSDLTISVALPPEADCTDGIDNDGDGDIDCADADCAGDPACVETDCTDGIDNDGDTLVDCDDDDCDLDPACLPPVPNDECVDAIPVGEGAFLFDNTGATSNGPSDCDTNMTTDVWYLYTATGGGLATIGTCNSAGLTDTTLCVYDAAGGCPIAGDAGLANDDDSCGGSGFLSEVQIAVRPGDSFLIQAGGWNGSEGAGEVTIALSGPANDDCANATGVGEGSFDYFNHLATLDGPTDCDGNMGADVWFLYTATVEGDATIGTCNTTGSLDDTVLCVYDATAGCPIAGDLGLASDDDSCGGSGFNSEVTLPVVIGTELLIQVGGFNGAEGNGTLDIDVAAALLNDNCVDAIAVSEGSLDFNNGGATLDGPTDCDGNMGSDVWFLYTASNSGDATISTCNTVGSLDDTVLCVYDGAPGCPPDGLASLASSDDEADCGPSAFNSSVTIPVVGGESYLVQVGGFNGATGDGTLDISLAIAGDACVDAVAVGEGSFDFNNTAATFEGPGDCDPGANMDTDVWFLYTATIAGDATIQTCNTIGTLDDTVLCVYDGAACPDPAGDVGLASDDDEAGCGPAGFNSTVTVPVEVGDTLLIQVGGWNGAEGDGTLDISVEVLCVDPTPSFTADVTSGIAPLTVNFTNSSDNGGDDLTTYDWDFGDGGTSTDENAANTYTDCGTYDVTLTANGCGASVALTETGLIQVFAMGDINGDCLVDVADAQALANYLFGGGSAPVCGGAADVNGDGNVDLGDVVYMLNFLFTGGPAPVAGTSC